MLPLLLAQSDAIAFLRRRRWKGALFMEPGIGKTRVGFELAKRARRTLVWAPLNPLEFVWPQQHQQWAPDLHFRIVRGTPAERARILFDERPQVAVINYELAHWLYDEVARRRKMPYELCLMDESTNAKNRSSIAWQVMNALLPAFDAVVPMTGTPAENSLHDLWGQLYMVDEGKALGKKVGIFRERYCSPVLRENYVSWKVTRPQELRLAAAPLCFVRRTADCVDMPPLAFRDFRFKLTDKEWRFYRKIKDQSIVDIRDDPYVVANTGVGLDKLRQVVSGFVYDQERIAHHIGDSRARALEECIDESFGQPLLVAFWYQGSKQAIFKRLGRKVPCIDRFTTRDEKHALLDAWSKGRLPILLGQIASVAKGLNMQSPESGVIFYDMPWSHGQHWQFIRRVWRQGQKTRVVVRRLIAWGTVDVYVASVLRRKENEEDDLMTTILNEELI